MTWRWVKEGVVLAVHDEQIAEHGGLKGVRDAGMLSSALMRPQQQYTYGNPTVFDLAAAYAFGIVNNHPFVDGNKRTGFLTAYIFLGLNGWELMASEAEAVTAVLNLAKGEMGENEFARWLNDLSVPYSEKS